MASYKVPQDVEADDKLIGPFSFRQFVYLIICAISIAMAWGLSMLFIPLLIIPLPIIVFFGALALPLRKDQPMEIYQAAVVSFYIKPRKRLWQPDGIQSLIEITAPKVVEVQRAKNLSQTEAQQRLSYLANIVDTGGWAVRGVAMPEVDSAMRGDVYFEAQQTPDILDESGGVAQSFDTMISQSDVKRRQAMVERMQHTTPTAAVPPIPDPYANLSVSEPVTANPPAFNEPDPILTLNPYPNSMHQAVIRPIDEQVVVTPVATQVSTLPAPATVSAPKPAPVEPPRPPVVEATESIAPTTSEKPVSPDIINLANNPDLSIETIAHEANRIQHKAETSNEDEVTVSFR